MTRFNLIASTLLLALAAGTAQAHGDWKCAKLPKEEWKPHTDLQKQLEGQGWRIRQMKTSNGCYEVYGVDPKGKRVEAFFDPKSFERIDKDDE